MMPDNQRTSANRRLAWLISLLFFVSLTALFCRQTVQRAVLLQSFLRAQAPPESALRELVEGTREPFVVLKRVWDTQKIPHRALVAAYLKENAGAHPELYRRAESLLLSAAMDVDGSVRELALATLTQQKHPAVPRLAAESLRDADPQIRLLGIQNLRRHDAAVALAPVFSLLDDPDLRVVTMSDSALRSWTGVDFGIRISQANLTAAKSSIDPVNLKIIRDGVRQWKAWWAAHRDDYPTNSFQTPAERVASRSLPLADFQLRDLNGRIVRVLDFKGKVVLLNFWTTWCPGCLVEIPDLIELQKRNAARLIVLGISLDGENEMDEHGDLVGARTDDGHGDDESRLAPAEVRAKVRQFVKEKGIHYPVLLDPKNEIGRRFNGGELPTNVLIDPQGNVRRRFLGGRTVAAFEAMLDELLPQREAREAPGSVIKSDIRNPGRNGFRNAANKKSTWFPERE